MKRASGLRLYSDRLHPAMVVDIESWANDPALGGLHATLTATTQDRAFLDAFAEAMVARHLRRHGWAIRLEVPTPNGRQCDFEVTRGARQFYLHVKRLESEKPQQRRLTISSRLRVLERIPRPYVIGIRWLDGLDDRAMQWFVAEVARFVQHARLGDEQRIRDENGTELGGARVVAPHDGSHVALMIDLPSAYMDETRRIGRLMRKAYRQFMPRAANIILFCGTHAEDEADFETALLGAQVERWDTHPPRNRRIAHGRAADGFWNERRRPDSRAACWFRFDPGSEGLHTRLWLRERPAVNTATRADLMDLFGA